MKLLIVDDDRSIRTLTARLAENWGYVTEECDSAESALLRLEHTRFNIILTDIKMGKIDGITFAETIREKMPSTAIIIMTGYPSTKTAKKSQDMGAVYYMKKPLEAEDLGNTLKIAASWNMGMLVDRAARRFLALRKGHERDIENRTKAVKFAIRRLLTSPGWMKHLLNFVYTAHVEKNELFMELNKKFSTDSVQPF